MAYVGTPRYQQSPVYTIASILQGESPTPDGMQAVASVIANRTAQGGFGGDDIMSVALAPNQFQGQAPPSPQAMAIAQQLLNGTLPDNTGGATFYANPDARSGPGATTAPWALRLNAGNSVNIGGNYFTDNTKGVPFRGVQTITPASVADAMVPPKLPPELTTAGLDADTAPATATATPVTPASPIQQASYSGTVPPGPYGADHLVHAIAVGNAEAVQPALDAVKVAISDSGDDPATAYAKVKNYLGSLPDDVSAAARNQVSLTPQILSPLGGYSTQAQQQISGPPPLPAPRPNTPMPPVDIPSAPSSSGVGDVVTPTTNTYGPGQSFPSGFNVWGGGPSLSSLPLSVSDPISPPATNSYGPGQSFPSGLGTPQFGRSITPSPIQNALVGGNPLTINAATTANPLASSLVSADPAAALTPPQPGDLPPELTSGVDTSMMPTPQSSPQSVMPAAPVPRQNNVVTNVNYTPNGAPPPSRAPISAWGGGGPYAGRPSGNGYNAFNGGSDIGPAGGGVSGFGGGGFFVGGPASYTPGQFSTNNFQSPFSPGYGAY